MIFVEAKPFTRRCPDYLTEDELREFQNYLVETPDAGDVIKNTGGLRKIRWKLKGGRQAWWSANHLLPACTELSYLPAVHLPEERI
jgi:hypothetical protein